MTGAPRPPAALKRRTTFEDLVFVRDSETLSPEERARWEPRRVRLVREGWLLSGALGFAVAVGRTILPIIVSPDLSFSSRSVIQIVAWTTMVGALCAARLVRPHVVKKREEFIRASRLREAMLRDTGSPDHDF